MVLFPFPGLRIKAMAVSHREVTLMDLDALNCLHKAELIPTPGQTEQEYLAELYFST